MYLIEFLNGVGEVKSFHYNDRRLNILVVSDSKNKFAVSNSFLTSRTVHSPNSIVYFNKFLSSVHLISYT